MLCCWAVQEGEKNCCDLPRFESRPGSPPALIRAQHCSLPPTQSWRDLPFLRLEGVLPGADKGGPYEHTVDVQCRRRDALSWEIRFPCSSLRDYSNVDYPMDLHGLFLQPPSCPSPSSLPEIKTDRKSSATANLARELSQSHLLS